VVGNRIVKIEPTKPPVGEVEPDLLAQLPLRSNAVAIANYQHPDQQLRIDRGTAYVAIEGAQLLVQVAQRRRHENIDPPQQVVLWDHVIEPKLVEKTGLVSFRSSHHRRIIPCSPKSQESSSGPPRKPFFDSIDPKQKSPAFASSGSQECPPRSALLGDHNRFDDRV
jgi:hypothetical protein